MGAKSCILQKDIPFGQELKRSCEGEIGSVLFRRWNLVAVLSETGLRKKSTVRNTTQLRLRDYGSSFYNFRKRYLFGDVSYCSLGSVLRRDGLVACASKAI